MRRHSLRMYRLFVALSLPEIVADALGQLQIGLPGARWIEEENFHLTLAFIGETDRHGLMEASFALSAIDSPTFSASLSGCGWFGEKKPRALWAGVRGGEALTRLQMKASTALARAGLIANPRKFTPHVTIARLDGVSAAGAAAFCAQHALFSAGPFPVEGFHLYESRRGGESAHYEVLESYALSR